MEDNSTSTAKISGYLEKKTKKKMIASYKKYWFVLEGGLLLFYRSEDEYKAISPCKGSINLGPPCNVKPCPSLPGVFQIETRSSTVTLRAESREEQNRWMQGVMAAISPKKSPVKLGHFRYSLDESPKRKSEGDVKTVESEQSLNKGIIERLQKMGAQSYVSPPGTVGRIKSVTEKSNSMESIHVTVDVPKPKDFSIKKPEYASIQRFCSAEDIEPRSKEHLYERISGDSLRSINKAYCEELQKSSPEVYSNKDVDYSLLRNYSYRQNSLIVENDTYISYKSKKQRSCAFKELKETVNVSNNKVEVETQTERSSFMLENDAYNFIVQQAVKDKGNEGLYAEALQTTDVNKNNLPSTEILTKNAQENAYFITDLYEISKLKPEAHYEDLEKYSEYAEPKHHDEECEDKKKDKKKKVKTKCKEGNTKLKKRTSFITRVWKRKNKKDKEVPSCEVAPDAIEGKIVMDGKTTVQMLHELQNILENKTTVLQERVIQTSPSLFRTAAELDTKSDVIKCKSCNNDITSNNTEHKSESSNPLLPPKTQKKVSSPYHDIPKNNAPIALPIKKKYKVENVKSIDEILDELDSQEMEENENKVKRLIKKFNEPEHRDVVLRVNKANYHFREDINSDELTRLLDELAKVTNAPILTPGATSSLISPNIQDDELTKLLPNRRRRHSEPDYDIPRSHKSFININKRDNPSENTIGSTRFFGPILRPSDIHICLNNGSRGQSPGVESITPDSLEVDNQKVTYPQTIFEDERISFTSHHYLQDNRCKKHVDYYNFRNTGKEPIDFIDDLEDDKNVYGQAKSFPSFGNYLVEETEEINRNHVGDDEVFVDSLEICNAETSTAF